MSNAKLLVDARAAHGESPYWSAQEGILYWLDIMNQDVHKYNPKTGTDERIHLSILPTTLVEKTGGGFLVSGKDGIYSFDHDFNKMEKVLELEQDNKHTRFNDGKADKAGRFWVGSMHVDGLPGFGSLYCVDKDYSVECKLKNLDISNSIAWSADTKKMYYTHTLSGQILCFDYDNETGAISGEQELYSFEGMLPDGMTIDEQDNLWIALWGAGKVVCLDTAARRLICTIDLDVPFVSAAAFGGEKLETLYITTSRLNMTDSDLEKHPRSGGLYAYETGVKGTLFSKFVEGD